MPTKREREYYAMGFRDGRRYQLDPERGRAIARDVGREELYPQPSRLDLLGKPKRKLSAWNKFVKANAKKPRFRYARSNKINLKKMAVAFRKTPAGKKKRR